MNMYLKMYAYSMLYTSMHLALNLSVQVCNCVCNNLFTTVFLLYVFLKYRKLLPQRSTINSTKQKIYTFPELLNHKQKLI